MDYYNQIDKLKAGLESYSDDEARLSELYKNAVANAEKDHAESTKALNEQYYRDRNEVYADTAREERNQYNMLAARGLGFSGEAAQTGLNSNIILANRLGALTREKNSQITQLESELAGRKTDLAMEEADKLREIQDSRNQLDADITSILLEKETADNKLQAEKDMHAAELQAEKDMFMAELNAKYNSGTGSGTGSGTETSNENSTGDGTEGDAGYIPPISATELAKRIITTAENGDDPSREYQEYMVNKYILELSDKYGVDSGYMDELLFILRAYGYDDVGENARRINVITYDSGAYYDNKYNEYYDKFIGEGYGEETARTKARTAAFNSQIEYIYKNSKNVVEFRNCCTAAGISGSAINDFLKRMESENSGFGNSNNGYATAITR